VVHGALSLATDALILRETEELVAVPALESDESGGSALRVTVKLFASAAEAAGARQQDVRLDGPMDVAGLLDRLCAGYPKLEKLRPILRVAVNHEYVAEDTKLADGDEVALIPPVSGGCR